LKIKFQSIGGGKSIGANCHYVEIDNIGLLLDAGINPHDHGFASLPQFEIVRNRIIDAILISHCHLDHAGALPIAVKNFPHARIFMSYVSSFLYSTMLHNAVTVMNILKLEKHIDEYPLYSHDDIDMISFIVQGMKFEKKFKLYGHENSQIGIDCTWYPAGHTLGAAGLSIEGKHGSIFFTGDTSMSNQFLLRGADYPKRPVDILISECTLGSNEEIEHIKRKNEVQKLIKIVNETFNKGGSVLIPAFALGKTQEILWLIDHLKKRKSIPEMDVYISGLGRAIARIYDLTKEYAHRMDEDFNFDDTDYHVIDSQDILSEGNWVKRPSIIIASSGMMLENTPSYWLAYSMMRHARHTICFVGYTSPDSPARTVSDSLKEQSIKLPGLLEGVPRNCRLEKLQFTGHSNRLQILEMIKAINPAKVVLVHGGNEESLTWTTQQIQEWDNHIEIIAPEIGQLCEL
jgi:Cft2 family RNA processing exonuclease